MRFEKNQNVFLFLLTRFQRRSKQKRNFSCFFCEEKVNRGLTNLGKVIISWWNFQRHKISIGHALKEIISVISISTFALKWWVSEKFFRMWQHLWCWKVLMKLKFPNIHWGAFKLKYMQRKNCLEEREQIKKLINFLER